MAWRFHAPEKIIPDLYLVPFPHNGEANLTPRAVPVTGMSLPHPFHFILRKTVGGIKDKVLSPVILGRLVIYKGGFRLIEVYFGAIGSQNTHQSRMVGVKMRDIKVCPVQVDIQLLQRQAHGTQTFLAVHTRAYNQKPSVPLYYIRIY